MRSRAAIREGLNRCEHLAPSMPSAAAAHQEVRVDSNFSVVVSKLQLFCVWRREIYALSACLYVMLRMTALSGSGYFPGWPA
mmetsp:Transcript_22966/g.66493  ORF Transcript_22966/g.66493 Transcript_22966/m.66493 type:complete len:82 (-) Transcript_22966:102-347(-)